MVSIPVISQCYDSMKNLSVCSNLGGEGAQRHLLPEHLLSCNFQCRTVFLWDLFY